MPSCRPPWTYGNCGYACRSGDSAPVWYSWRPPFWMPRCTPKEDLAGLYRARWHAELELRSIKQTMQMDVLRCKTPAMVRQEIWGHLLVDNLLRAAMAHAALGHGVVPRQVSLQGTRQTLAAFHSLLAQMPSTARKSIVHIVLSAIARHRVGTRPDRYEPRACKRRPKPYPLLRVPRQQARARLATAA